VRLIGGINLAFQDLVIGSSGNRVIDGGLSDNLQSITRLPND
jgi:hypothetical protein